VQLVISEHHRGLMAAVDQVMAGSTWQRSSVNLTGGGIVSLVHLHRRERTLAT
jgi:hypothetical protein